MNPTYKVELTNLIKPIIDLTKAANNEYKHQFLVGVEEYLINQTYKFLKTKTFLHPNLSRFYDIYYPLSIYKSNFTTNFQDVKLFFTHNFYSLIIGTAGSGKSMLMKYIFLQCIINKFKIPIFIELRKFNHTQKCFKEIIIEKILGNKIKPSIGTLERSLKNGDFIFILDGYDEIYEETRNIFDSELDEFLDNYHKNNFIISSRPRSGAESIERFEIFNMAEITNNDYVPFIKKVVSNTERKKALFKVITNEANKKYLHFFSNPLLFSMFILAFESHPEIPKKISIFYDNVFDTLYNKHDGMTKGSFKRQRLTGLEKSDFIEILSLFSAMSFTNGEYFFTEEKIAKYLKDIKDGRSKYKYKVDNLIKDLDVSISIIVKDGLEYTFPHRSIQEYFTCLFIKNMKKKKSKKSFIKQLIENSKKKSRDRHINFWKLLKEIDQESFYRYYQRPILKELINIHVLNIDSSPSYGTSSLKTLMKKLEFGLYYLVFKESEINIYEEYSMKEIKAFGYEFLKNIHDPVKSRILKIRHIDNIYWDAIDFTNDVLKYDFIEYFNLPSNLVKLRTTTDSLFINTKDKMMVSINAIMNIDLFNKLTEELKISNLYLILISSIKLELKELKSKFKKDNKEIDDILKLM